MMAGKEITERAHICGGLEGIQIVEVFTQPEPLGP